MARKTNALRLVTDARKRPTFKFPQRYTSWDGGWINARCRIVHTFTLEDKYGSVEMCVIELARAELPSSMARVDSFITTPKFRLSRTDIPK